MIEADIPIDIHTGKLQEWLVSRRHVKKEWQKNVLPIREKINNAIQDMPAHDGIARLLSGAHINYFHCLKIVDILKETEADSKNLFGRYGSQRMKDWLEIIRLYERDNVYLAEAGSVFVRNVNYEVPGLRKQIAKFEQFQNECERKATDFTKKEAALRGEFNTVCKQIGITGENIRAELIEKLKELPDFYQKIGAHMSELKPAVELYSMFTKCFLNEQQAKTCLPLLKHIIEHGNTTLYEWTYGEAPLQIVPDKIVVDLNVEDSKEDQIDFGDTAAPVESIDFGEFVNNSETIDFGDDGANTGEIDWGDVGNVNSEVDFTNLNEGLKNEIVLEESGTMGGIARGKEALTLLDSPSTRGMVIDQLMELETFLKMRIHEISNDTTYSTFSSFHDLPIESADNISSLIEKVQSSISEMTDKKINHLHNIKHSPRYVDILSNQLKQKTVMCKKMNEQIDIVKNKKKEAHSQAQAIVPILNLIIEKTKELQLEIEADISKKYNGRPVYLTGGIKSL